MAISKKGLRKISIEGNIFYWKFNEKVFVITEKSKNAPLIIDFGWYDVWDYANDKENRPPNPDIQTATPEFVSQSIRYALSQGWDKKKMEIKFQNGVFEKKD